jgi:hypothetical protein
MKRRPGLFNGFWWTLDGEKIRRASRADIAEAYRLWAKHADIRALSANPQRRATSATLAPFAGVSDGTLRPRPFRHEQEALW